MLAARLVRALPRLSIVRLADPVTGYVRLDEFGEKAASEVHDALKRLRGQGATQFMLDLRRNPGGEVRASVELASEFFPKNTVVFSTRGRKKEVDTTFVTKRDGEFRSAPLIVLIDGGSASAAEALAASLQDHDRALLLGRRSFGKALMQTAFLTPSGDVVWLTVGRVITPSGRFIQRRYRGLRYEEYRAFGGGAGAGEDTLETFRTDNGRTMRGGGGIRLKYGHPTPEAIGRLERAHARVYRTDRDGTVTVETDGDRIAVTTANGKREILAATR